MRKLLFLDVDGVLNNTSVLHLSPQLSSNNLEHLKIIVTATQCEIVLSSTWRFFPTSKQELARAFNDLNMPLWIGQTPEIQDANRCDEIILWLKTNNDVPAKVMVIDDDEDANIVDHDMLHIINAFTHTNMQHGLTADQAIQVIQFFSEMPQKRAPIT